MIHNGKPTMLIGLDGATFSILDPLMEKGHMPFLKQFVAKGVRAELASTIPPITPPAWTSIMTGRSPANHGILDFFRPESPGSHFLRFVNTKQLKCETIWALLTRHDISSISLNFPVMSPPLPIKGYSIPGFVTWRHLRRACHPENLMDTLKTIPGFDLKVIAHDFGLEEKVVEGCSHDEAEDWIKYHTYKDRQWVLVLQSLLERDGRKLSAVILDSPDRLQHVFYRLLDPACFSSRFSREARRIRKILVAHYTALDEMIARLVTDAGPDTNCFIVSDHGFGPSKECFHLNTFLAQKGYLRWSKVRNANQRTRSDVSMDAIRNHGHLLDWEKTIAYVNTPSSNGITVNVRGVNSETGVAPEDYDTFIDTLKHQLFDLRHPYTGEAVVKEIWTRSEAFGGDPSAPDLTLRLWDNGLVSTLKSEKIIMRRRKTIGVHYPMGVFIASGPDIKACVETEPLNILDVAPAMLYSLGLAIPEALEGRVPEEIWRREALANRPVTFVNADPGFDPQVASGIEMDEQDMDLILKRLKGLGYMA